MAGAPFGAPFMGDSNGEEDLPAEDLYPEESDVPGPEAAARGPHQQQGQQEALMRRLLEYDPATGTKQWHDYDELTRESTIITVQDCQPYIDRNKEHAKDDDRKKRGIKDGMWHFATVPNGVIEQWLKKGVNLYNKDHAPEVKKLLNSPEWAYLRTTTGRM